MSTFTKRVRLTFGLLLASLPALIAVAQDVPAEKGLQYFKGKVIPLADLLAKRDAKLLKRPMRLTGKLIPGTQLLQVINVHSIVNGKLHEVYYWCDICTIKGYETGNCDCCGAPMEFREVPLK